MNLLPAGQSAILLVLGLQHKSVGDITVVHLLETECKFNKCLDCSARK